MHQPHKTITATSVIQPTIIQQSSIVNVRTLTVCPYFFKKIATSKYFYVQYDHIFFQKLTNITSIFHLLLYSSLEINQQKETISKSCSKPLQYNFVQYTITQHK